MKTIVSPDEEHIEQNKKYLQNAGKDILNLSRKHMALINKHKGNMHSVFNELADGETLVLYACIVHEIMDFSNLDIAHPCIFENVNFEKRVLARNANFHKGLAFAFCNVDGDVDLSHAHVAALETNVGEESYVVTRQEECSLYITDMDIYGNLLLSHSQLYDFDCEYSECRDLIAYQTHVSESFYIDDFSCENINVTEATFCSDYRGGVHYQGKEKVVKFGIYSTTCNSSLCLEKAVFYQPPSLWNVTTKQFLKNNAQYEGIPTPTFNIETLKSGMLRIETKDD